MNYKTLLVDDEFMALNLLEEFVAKIPDLEIMDKIKSPVKAIEILQNQQVDLLFLDIQMPVLSGNNLLKSLSNPPVTIFTTAYSDYALEAFDLNAVDYLLKPFSFERFLQAVNKGKQQIKKRQNLPNLSTDTFITVKVDGRLEKISFDEILFVEGLKEYVRIVCKDKRLVTLERLKNMEGLLPSQNFLRVHKSFIVSTKRVRTLNGNMLEIGKYKIPISRNKKEEVIQSIFFSKGK